MNLNNQKRTVNIFIHILTWALLFGIPFLFLEKRGPGPAPSGYKDFLVIPLNYMLVFYSNYFWLIDRLLFRKQTVRFILWNVLIIVLAGLITHLFHKNQVPVHIRPRPIIDQFIFMSRDMIWLILTAGLSVAIKMTNRWILSEKELQELEKSRTEAELKNLKNQLNPHFLFNTLNNIYSLIAISPEKAQSAVHELSKLLRHALYENNSRFVPIEKELDFIRNYIELMKLRLSRDIKVSVDIPDPICNGHFIAPLLFISLIENAFKHGISASEPSYLIIKISELAPNMISCYTENSYYPKNAQDKSGSGIGLDNLKRQLNLLYPGCYQLETEHDNEKYFCRLTIILKEKEELP